MSFSLINASDFGFNWKVPYIILSSLSISSKSETNVVMDLNPFNSANKYK